ncbi:MAG: NfeD family protein [Lachnospiraceae bacterium]
MRMAVIFWLVLLIVLLLIEIITVGLTTIWFAGGALAAVLVCAVGGNEVVQFLVFLTVSLLLLFFTRPVAVKYINRNREKTNYEGIIGKEVRITQRVENRNNTGKAMLGGQEWTVRSEMEDLVLEPGSIAKVVRIEGVKLIVKKEED